MAGEVQSFRDWIGEPMFDVMHIGPGSPRPAPEPASDPKFIKHVFCDGARYHVISYHYGNGIARRECSEPNCIINKEMPK